MRKIFIVLSISLLLIFFSSATYANLLVNGGFEDSTGIVSNAVVWDANYIPDGAEKFINDTYNVGIDEGQWFDWRQWVRVDGEANFDVNAPTGYTGDHFAYHAIQYSYNADGSIKMGNNTDLLFQGVYLPSGFSAGTQVSLSFDYILNPNTVLEWGAKAYVLGFVDGGKLENNAPFNAYYDGTSGVSLSLYDDHTPLEETLGQTAEDTWNSMAYSFILEEDFDALVVAFSFRGKDSIDPYGPIFAGIDNVNLSVPEPTTLLLLGFGFLGLVGLRRKE